MTNTEGGQSYRGYDDAKRIFDVAVASTVLLLTLPLWLEIALLIALDSPGPVLFRQVRAGRGGTPFTLLKFRTMRVGTPNLPTDQMTAQHGKSAITRVGGLLRRYSLDELPQLVNVLRGEMSLVGPRPALPSQTRLLALRRATEADCLMPGLTGWAQINGRDDLDDAAKADFDAYYLKHRSLLFDLRIIAQTCTPVLLGKGNR